MLREAVEKARGEGRYLAKGLNASPGAATGRAVFDADRAVELKGAKQLVVLVLTLCVLPALLLVFLGPPLLSLLG